MVELVVSAEERLALYFVRSLNRCRIVDAPVRA